jgi:hypothetical protein
MKNPRKQPGEPAQWSVYIMRSKLSWIGSVEARDAEEAKEKALKQLDISQRAFNPLGTSLTSNLCRHTLCPG